MDMRNPERSLSWALMQAVEHDLAGMESQVVDDLLRTGTSPLKRRPRRDECAVVLFAQTWLGRELGFHERHGGDEHIEADTVVVTGPMGDACVYVSTQLLYRLQEPNRRFFLDLTSQRMRGRAERHLYAGRDTDDEETFDYEVASVLARLRGAVRDLGIEDAERVARLLRDGIDEMFDDLGEASIKGHHTAS